MSALLEDDTPWTWTKSTFEVDGTRYTEWKGEHPYRHGYVSNFANGGFWQARIGTLGGDQHSPYYKTDKAAKAWCERYGKPKIKPKGHRLAQVTEL